ncbi:hypothetical protein [uncultured Amaricoccus sp.]|uniref:hypothetical protein n=1 Tax=uncultured Amaricoccus sp. TaxID=339341 RepID=UPI0026277E93|nr:hypothetical protein [uncultured Amaricoccus sp.]
MRFTFSHAFRGGCVIVDDDGTTGPECLVEFGDGVTVVSEWRRGGDVMDLEIPAHRTAKGARIAARRWRLVRRKDGTWRSERASGEVETP